MKVTAYVIAFNEEEKIRDCVQTLLWADEIIVADSGSADRTAEIAVELGARVVQIPFEGFGDLRNKAIAHCTGDWIFSLDADERCTAEVRDEVTAIVNNPEALDIYRVPRRNWFMGRWIRHSGWYPNYRQPQLFRNGSMRYGTEPVHEGWVSLSDKPLGALNAAIWQLPFRNLAETVDKGNRYSTLGVDKLVDKGRQGSFLSALFHGWWAFTKHFIFKKGFLDGWAGFMIALMNFNGTFYRYAKLAERQSDWTFPPGEPVTKAGESTLK